jgi:hypothetical protein
MEGPCGHSKGNPVSTKTELVPVPDSQAQVGLAGAVVSGKSNKMPWKVAREILDKMEGRKVSELPRYSRGPEKKAPKKVSTRYER